MILRRRARQLNRARAGAAALEFALVAPLFLALVAGTVELSRWAWGAAAVRDLAARGARCIAVTPASCGSATAVRHQLDRLAPQINAGATLDFARSGCGIKVTARGGFPASFTPGLGPTEASACAN